MNELIFGKDKTERVVSVEPGHADTCELFIQGDNGGVSRKTVPMSHWALFTEKYSDKFKTLEGNQPYRFLMEYETKAKFDDVLKQCRQKRYDRFTVRDPKEAYMVKEGVTYYKGLKVKDVSVLSFDLEHSFGIGDTLNRKGKLLLISNTYRNGDRLEKRLFSFDEYNSEAEMLLAWLDWVYQMDPSILIGHNIFGHDFKVLEFASRRAGVPLRLGRDNSALKFDSEKSFKRKDGSQAYEYHNVHCYGREIVDTFFLALTFDVARKYESYGLKQIIKQEGLERANRTHVDASEIPKRYLEPEFWARVKDYAKDDADDALALFDLMIPSFFYLTQSIPKGLQSIVNSATGGWINSFLIRSYLQIGHSIAKASPLPERTEGGISFAVPGIYKNLYKVDLKSAYPSQVLRFKLYDHTKDPKAHFYEMVKYFTEEKFSLSAKYKETKNQYFKHREGASKVFINSAYGVTITNKLNYNSPAIGAKITEETRKMIDMALLWASGKPRQHWVKLFKEKTGQDDVT